MSDKTETWTPPSDELMIEYKKTKDKNNPVLHNSRWNVHTAIEAMQPQPPIEYLVEGVIQRAAVTCIYGDGGIGKTYLIMHLGACVTVNIGWLGMKTKKGNVLLIDEESGTRRVLRRLREIILGEAIQPDIPFSFVSYAHFKLDDYKDCALLEGLIVETKADLVIIDALADVMSGDENSKQDTQPVFYELKRIAENTNAAIVIIHHSNKAGAYRGSSAIKDSVDMLIQVSSESNTNRIDFKTEKSRDSESIKFSAVATWIGDQFYLNRTEKSDKPNLGKAQNYVMRFLEEHGPATVQDVMAGADVCAPNGARSAVYSLADLGLIKRTNPGKSIMTTAIYDLSERGA